MDTCILCQQKFGGVVYFCLVIAKNKCCSFKNVLTKGNIDTNHLFKVINSAKAQPTMFVVLFLSALIPESPIFLHMTWCTCIDLYFFTRQLIIELYMFLKEFRVLQF